MTTQPAPMSTLGPDDERDELHRLYYLRDVAAFGCTGALTSLVQSGAVTNVTALECVRRYEQANRAVHDYLYGGSKA